jgi:His-Xaa-Ser system radical SAM maturase HxsB
MPRLMFYGPSHFKAVQSNRSEFLPFRFIDLDSQRVVVVNEVGEHHVLDRRVFDRFIRRELAPDTTEYRDLEAKHFVYDGQSQVPIRLLATKYRTKRQFLAGFTDLHIFVVSLRCEHSCHYCQVSRVSQDRSRYDMTPETAERALDLVFRSPAQVLKIEFQGGEPLLNFDLVKHIVESAERRNQHEQRDVQFVVATNLAVATSEMLDFFREHDVLVSTSIDGPAELHNANRPRPGGNSYELAVIGIERARAMLGIDRVSALMTTTRRSLEIPEAIVDEYVKLGFDTIFVRPISPYGFAVRTQLKTGYERQVFLDFYVRALDHVIKLNRGGKFFVEAYAQLLLKKILTPFATGYVDLQSPAGAGISVAVYNYDGDVYATDESRMLAEMGDKTFRLGNVHTDSYERMFGGELLKTLVAASCVESLPGCCDCAFQTYCGCDPVENYATQGDIFGHRPTSDFCRRNMFIIKHLLELYHGDDPFIRELFWAWVQNRPATDLTKAYAAPV